MITEQQIDELATSRPVMEAANELLGLNTLHSGDSVVVVADPTFPYDGLRGKVVGSVSANISGTVNVQFANGDTVPLAANQLLRV